MELIYLVALHLSCCWLMSGIPSYCDAHEAVEGGSIELPSNTRQSASTTPLLASHCSTPDGKQGVCVTLDFCQPYLSLLRHPTSGALTFLRDTICYFQNNEPFICCPHNGEVGHVGSGLAPATPVRPVAKLTPTTTPTPLLPPPMEPSSLEQLQTAGGQLLHEVCGPDRVIADRFAYNTERAWEGTWPWVAALGYEGTGGKLEWRCGASLITNRHLLTAAHCVFDRSDLRVARLGDHNLDVPDDAPAVDFKISKVMIHEEYDGRSFENDIAVLELEQEVPFSEHILPVCLPPKQYQHKYKDFTGYSPFVGGWWEVDHQAMEFSGGNVLLQVDKRVISNTECERIFAPLRNLKITASKLCTSIGKSTPSPMLDRCQEGPSGWPMITTHHNDDRKVVLIGVSSYGFHCRKERIRIPGVFTRVTEYLDWIAEKVSSTTKPSA